LISEEKENKVTENSLWKIFENRKKIFWIAYQVFFSLFGVGFGIVFFGAILMGKNSVFFKTGMVVLLIWGVVNLVISLLNQQYGDEVDIIRRIKQGIIIEQLIEIAKNTFVAVSKPITKIQRKLAIAALAEQGAEQALPALEKIAVTESKDLKKIASKAIKEIEKHHELNVNSKDLEPYKDKFGKSISLYDFQKKEMKSLVTIGMIPLYILATVIVILGVIFTILYTNVRVEAISFIGLGVFLVVFMAIYSSVIIKRIKKLKTFEEAGEIEKLIEMARKGDRAILRHASVICAIALLGDIGNEIAIPTLLFLLNIKHRRMRYCVAIAIDKIYAKNDCSKRKFIPL